MNALLGSVMSNEKLYSTGEVAVRYEVTERTVRNWIDAGLFPGAVKKAPLTKSSWQIPESALDAFEEKRMAMSSRS
jgi:hypothetical protein